MTAQVTRVRTKGPVQTESTDSSAAAHQDLMAHNVKQVTIFNIDIPSFFIVAACSIVQKCHYFGLSH